MEYELVIVGAGPAGLSASVYASRYGIKNIVIGQIPGGLATETHKIGNWLGTPEISGFDFAENAVKHVKSLGAEVSVLGVDQIEKTTGGFDLWLSNGDKVTAKTMLLAMGTKHRHIGAPGEKELLGKGVSYCATCDGFFYRGKTVAVVGGGDSAASAAIYLSNIAKEVYLIYRGDKLRAESFWVRNIEENEKIKVIYNTNIQEIVGTEKLEKVILDNDFRDSKELTLDGLFVEIGLEPNGSIAKNLEVNFDDEGCIIVDADGRTSVTGVWAAGDITIGSNKFRQIVTAASEGAIAANSIQGYLRRKK